MKQNLKQVISLLLCMVMLVGMVPVSYGETLEQTGVIENTIQVVGLAQECAGQQLTSNEVAAYQEIATALQEQTQAETPSIRVTNQDETTVYTLGESTEEHQIVIQATTSKNNTESAVTVTAYEEIVITTETAETEALEASEESSGMPELAEALEAEAVASPEETTEIPEVTEVAETEAIAASDEIAEVSVTEEVPEAEAAVSPKEATEVSVGTEVAETEAVVVSEEATEAAALSEEATEATEPTENAETEVQTVLEEVMEVPEASLELTEATGAPADADTLNSPDPFAQTEFENEYKNAVTTVITAEELLTKVESGDGFSITFANKLGFGKNAKEISKNLKAIVDEYHEQINKGVEFEKPRFIINGVDITANSKVEDLKLTLQPDGTYTASLTGTETGYRTSVLIDAEASVTIIYDEKGEAKIERKVKSGKPTDFVIALDISGSMKDYGRDKAMLSALKVVLDEILAVEENTASIVFWAEDGAEMRVKVDGKGIISTFSGKDGLTADSVFDAKLVSSAGSESYFSLSEATISRLESLYKTGSGTEPDEGLATALNILESIEKSPDRKVGVMMFTDGAANYTSSERETVNLEKKIAEDYGATIVNVSIGDEYDVKKYERYLDPKSNTYYQKGDKVLEKQVVYYNIPKLTHQELADRVSEIFEVAFEDIVTETKELQTETITDGVLAAYSAKLIETIPAGFELIEYRDETGFTNYEISGKDEQGNTTITFDLEDIVSGKDQVVSYCVIPTKADNDIGVVAYADKSETVLVAEPIDRWEAPEDKQKVSITATRENDAPILRPERVDSPDHKHKVSNGSVVYTEYTPLDAFQHAITKQRFVGTCAICGKKVTYSTTYTNNVELEDHTFENGECVKCHFSLVEYYLELLKKIIDAGENPLENDEFLTIMKRLIQPAFRIDDTQFKAYIDYLGTFSEKRRNLNLEYMGKNYCGKNGYHNYKVVSDSHMRQAVGDADEARHKKVFACDCGSRYEEIGTMLDCCQCVGHRWSEIAFDAQNGTAFHFCLICKKQESVYINQAANYSAYLELREKWENGEPAWKTLAKNSATYLANGGGVLGEIINLTSSPGSYLYDNLIDGALFGMNDRSKMKVDIWIDIILDMVNERSANEAENNFAEKAIDIVDFAALFSDPHLEKALEASKENYENFGKQIQKLKLAEKSIDAQYDLENVLKTSLTNSGKDALQNKFKADAELDKALSQLKERQNVYETYDAISTAIPYAFAIVEGFVDSTDASSKVKEYQNAYTKMAKNYEENCKILLNIINSAEALDDEEMKCAAQTVLNKVTNKYLKSVSDTTENLSSFMKNVENNITEWGERTSAAFMGFADGFAESLSDALVLMLEYTVKDISILPIATWSFSISGMTTNADEMLEQTQKLSLLLDMNSSSTEINFFLDKFETGNNDYAIEMWSRLQQLGTDEACKLIDILQKDNFLHYMSPGGVSLKEFGVNVGKEEAKQLLESQKQEFQEYIKIVNSN